MGEEWGREGEEAQRLKLKVQGKEQGPSIRVSISPVWIAVGQMGETSSLTLEFGHFRSALSARPASPPRRASGTKRTGGRERDRRPRSAVSPNRRGPCRCVRAAAGRDDTAALPGGRARAERGCVPRRAGSAAAAPTGVAETTTAKPSRGWLRAAAGRGDTAALRGRTRWSRTWPLVLPLSFELCPWNFFSTPSVQAKPHQTRWHFLPAL